MPVTPAAALAERHGAGALAGLVRRGLLRAEVRERPRRPLAGRPVGLRGARPAGAALTAGQDAALAPGPGGDRAARPDADPARRRHGRRQDRDLRRGDRRVARERPAGRSCSSRRSRWRRRSWTGCALELPVRIAVLHSGLGRRGAGRRVAPDPGRRRGPRRRDADGPARAAGRRRPDRRGRGARRGLQERPDAAVPGARRRAGARRSSPGAAVVLGSATPVRGDDGPRPGRALPARGAADAPVGTEPRVTAVDLRAELAAGNRGLLSDALAGALGRAGHGARATGRSSSSTGAGRRRWSCAATAATCRPARTATGRSSTTRPARRCAATTAGARGRRPRAARRCGSPRIRYLGGGTERVEREVRERFPGLRVGRLDRDVVERKGAADRVLDDFADGRLDVLVGTSLVAKGLDIAGGDARRRRLGGHRAQPARRAGVGADVPAAGPGRRACGPRATGRGSRSSRPTGRSTGRSAPSSRATPPRFYDEELALRERFGSPPFGRLVKLTVGLADREAAEREAVAMAERLRARARERGAARAGRRARPRLRGPPRRPLAIPRDPARRRIRSRLLDPPPGAPWSVDVDPESLL